MAFPGAGSLARTLLTRLSRPAVHPPPFFTPTSLLPSSRHSLATFTPSYRPAGLARPSHPFLALRHAFHQPIADAARPSTRRAFSTSALVRGIRPYYGRGGSGSSYGRRRDPNWRERIDALPGQYLVYGLIGALALLLVLLLHHDSLFRASSSPLVESSWLTRPSLLLAAVNVGVFAAWQYGNELALRFRDASWLKFLQRNFTVSWQNITSGRVWTLVTSAFSHEGTGHILVNMLSL